MTNLSPAAQAVLDAFLDEWPDEALEQDRRCLAAALRAVVAITQQYQGNDCFSDEIWTCDADELYAIAAELEALPE